MTDFAPHGQQRNQDGLIQDIQGEDQWFSLLDMPLEVPEPENYSLYETVIDIGPNVGETFNITHNRTIEVRQSIVESDLCYFIKIVGFVVSIMLIAFPFFALKEYF